MPRPVTKERETMTTMMGRIFKRSPSARSNVEEYLSYNDPKDSPERNAVDCEPPRRSALIWRGARDLSEFSTPQRVTVMGRERQIVEFRTPQYPVAGTNKWGGASPLLSRNIPQESRCTSYLRFNSVSALDYHDDDDDDKTGSPARADSRATRMGHATPPARHGRKRGSGARRGVMFSILRWWRRRRVVVVLGREKRKCRWRPRGDYRNRWPQGWR